MKQIKIKQQFVVFLFAYFRQIDLSIDRGRTVPWQELRDYYKTQLDPLVVAEALKKQSCLKLEYNRNAITIIPGRPSVLSKVNNFFFRIFNKKYLISEAEVEYCYYLLYKFNDLLTYNLDGFILETGQSKIDLAKWYIESLRQEVLNIYAICIGSCLLNSDKAQALQVEFYSHGKNAKLVPIEHLIEDFLL